MSHVNKLREISILKWSFINETHVTLSFHRFLHSCFFKTFRTMKKVIEEEDMRGWVRRMEGRKTEGGTGYCRMVVVKMLERLDEQSSESDD